MYYSTLIKSGCNYRPLLESSNFFGPNTRLTSDQSVNSKLTVVVQTKKNSGVPTKLENTFFQMVKLRFLTISDRIPDFSKNSQGKSFKARGLIFWIHLYTHRKTEFAKHFFPFFPIFFLRHNLFS